MQEIAPQWSWCSLICSIGCGTPCAVCWIDPIPADEAAGTKGGIVGSVTLGGIVGGYLG